MSLSQGSPRAGVQLQMQQDGYNINSIPIGKCMRCGVDQTSAAEGGFWIHGMKKDWACTDCKYGHNGPEIRSHPTACEWCTFDNVKWFQGNTYNCPRCKHLGIGQSSPAHVAAMENLSLGLSGVTGMISQVDIGDNNCDPSTMKTSKK